VRDEHVRTITRLADRSEIVYLHFSRYGDESAEREDVTITLTRTS
jgi:hypothetical protein